MKCRARILSSAKALHASLTARLGVREVGAIIAFFISAVLILGFWNIAEEVTEGETHELDTAALMSFRTPGDQTDLIGPEWVEEMVRDVTALGSYAFIIIVVVSALGYLLLIRKRALGLLMVACVASGMLLSRGLKAAFAKAVLATPRALISASGGGRYSRNRWQPDAYVIAIPALHYMPHEGPVSLLRRAYRPRHRVQARRR